MTEEDVKSMFHYPDHRWEVVVIPLDSISDLEKIGTRLSEPPYAYEVLLKKRTIFVMQGRRLHEFVRENPGEYVIMDEDSILFYGPGLEHLGPLNFERRPKNQKIAKLFELYNALRKRIESLRESHLNLPQPSETEISEWRARIDLVASETKVYRWNRKTGARELHLASRTF